MGTIEEVLRLKDEASPALRGVAGEAARASSEIRDTASSSSDLGGGLRNLGVGAAAAAVGFQQMISRVIETRREIDFLSGTTGASVETVAGLRQAFRLAGREASEAEGALKGLQQQLRAAADGSESAAKAFSDIGLSGSALAGGDFDAALARVVANLESIEDRGARARAAMAVFGEEGTKLMAALGDERLQSFIDLTQRYGDSAGPAAVRVTEEWTDAWGRAQLAIEGTAGAITNKVLPAATGALRLLLEFSSTLGFLLNDAVDVALQPLGFSSGRAAGTGFGDGTAVERARESVARLFGERSAKAGRGSGFVAPEVLAAQGLASGLSGTGSLFDQIRGFISGPGGGGGTAGGGKSFAALSRAEIDALRKITETFSAQLDGVFQAELDQRKRAADDLYAKLQEQNRQEIAQNAAVKAQSAATAEKLAQIRDQQLADADAARTLAKDLADKEYEAAQRRRQQAAATAVAATSAAAGVITNAAGTIPGLLAGAGPAGAIAGTSIGLLGALGDPNFGGAKGVEQQLDLFVKGIVRGLEALPEILLQVLPDFVGAIVTELPPALARAIAELIAGPLRGLPQRLDQAVATSDLIAGNRPSALGVLDTFSTAAPDRRSNPNAGRGVTVVNNGYITPRAQQQQIDDLNRILGPRGLNHSLRGT